MFRFVVAAALITSFNSKVMLQNIQKYWQLFDSKKEYCRAI